VFCLFGLRLEHDVLAFEGLSALNLAAPPMIACLSTSVSTINPTVMPLAVAMPMSHRACGVFINALMSCWSSLPSLSVVPKRVTLASASFA
jgi:hypothetical protein